MIWSGIAAPNSQRRRVWHVRVYPRTEGRVETLQILDVHELYLADAMAKAVEESERRGWHRPLSQTADPPAPPLPR